MFNIVHGPSPNKINTIKKVSIQVKVPILKVHIFVFKVQKDKEL